MATAEMQAHLYHRMRMMLLCLDVQLRCDSILADDSVISCIRCNKDDDDATAAGAAKSNAPCTQTARASRDQLHRNAAPGAIGVANYGATTKRRDDETTRLLAS